MLELYVVLSLILSATEFILLMRVKLRNLCNSVVLYKLIIPVGCLMLKRK